MLHGHPVRDTDHHFIIDPITRAVNNADQKKLMLMQYDHNSEVLTFEIPKEVEEHDMSLCDTVEVHYININSTTRARSVGVYTVNDLEASSEDPNTLAFTWTVSENATLYAGPLNFLIMFKCTSEGEVTYRWSSNINSSITISTGINNGPAIEESFPDILTEWKYDIYLQMREIEETVASRNYAYEVAVKNGYTGTEKQWANQVSVDTGVDEHAADTVKHITAAERTKWDNKLSASDLTYDSQPMANSSSLLKSGAIYDALDKKQPRMSFDSTPTSNSTNLVNSGVIYSELNKKAPNNHSHSANYIAAGTFGGKMVAKKTEVASVTVKQVRNIYAGTENMVAGETYLASGDIYLVYEVE